MPPKRNPVAERRYDTVHLRDLVEIRDELVEAVNGMRDRHHDSMNSIAAQMGKMEISMMALTSQQKGLEKAVEALATGLQHHIKEPGHQDTMEWRAGLMGELKAQARLSSIKASITGSITSGIVVGVVVWAVTQGG